MQVRDRLHRLIDALPEDELLVVERLVDDRRKGDDPLLRALLAAPDDDEPLTESDIAALDEAYAEIAAGRLIDDAEVWRRGDDASPR